jgi:ubiquinone/menaquinone biosynthesis C-methylase UbiE
MKEIFQNQRAYFKWRVERVKRIEKRFPELFNVKGKKVLDVGCGAEAPLSYYLSEKKAKVWGGEISKEFVKTAKKFAPNANISLFFAEALPFKDETFDIVYLWDILEHVKNPFKAVKEAKRVCKKGGLIFIEFSPYWAYPTGHHLYMLGFPRGFLPFQWLPLSWTKKIVLNSKLIIKDKPASLFRQFQLLNKLSVNKFKKIIEAQKLKKLREFYFISLPHREVKINFISKIPLFKELLTMSYSALFKKQ